MPKIKITEVDNTGAIQLSSTSNVVYIPGLSVSGNVAPFLYTSAKQLEDASAQYVQEDSYAIAHRLLELGMQVLFEGCVGSGTVDSEDREYTTKILKGVNEDTGDEYNYFKVAGIGSDIEFVIDEDTITFKAGSESEDTYSVSISGGVADFTDVTIDNFAKVIKTATINPSYNTVVYTKNVTIKATSIATPDWKRLEDFNSYNIRFLTTGAYADIDTNGMLSCAVHRGDCVALLDHAKSLTSVADIRSVIEEKIAQSSENDKAGAFSTAFTPWFNVHLDDTGKEFCVPGSVGYLLAYARSVQTNPSWYAAAGSFRGVIPGFVSPVVVFSKADCERLQARAAGGEVGLDDAGDNEGMAINPICNIRPFGYIVFGNRTLVNNDGSTIATSFLNVRNLVSTLKKEMYATANKYTFEQNSEVLWINFKSQITPLLDRMQSGNGIEGYKLVKQATNKKARLKAKVIIIPIEAVEDFELEVSLEDSLEVVEG